MNYIIDPKVFSAVFTVPAAVADKRENGIAQRIIHHAVQLFA